MAQYFTGKGYGISDITDINGRPLLTYQGPEDKKPLLLSDRVAVVKDPTIRQPWTLDELYNTRIDKTTSQYVKQQLGGSNTDELDHKIPLELGGANTPANFRIEPHIPGTQGTFTDPIETALSQRVQKGEISLLEAWRADVLAKGYRLGEDYNAGVTFGFAEVLEKAYVVYNGMTDPVLRRNLGKLNSVLLAQIQSDIERVKANPLDQKAISALFQNQVDLTAQQLAISHDDAAQLVRSVLAVTTNQNGVDPREMLQAVTLDAQKIISSAGTDPNVYGVKNTTLAKLGAAASLVAPVLINLGIALLVIGIIYGGAEVLASATALGILRAALGVIGEGGFAAYTIGAGGIIFAAGESIEKLGTNIPMATKQVYDSGYLLPTQQISAIKDFLAIQKTLNAQIGGSTKKGAGGIGSPFGGAGGNVVITRVSGGVVGSAAAFVPRPKDTIENATDLTNAAQNNLSGWLTALPGRLIYDIKLDPHVINDDGTLRIGGKNRVVSKYDKKGKPEYKTISNKFAVLEIFYLKAPGVRQTLGKITLGPLDELSYKPSDAQREEIISHLQNQFIIGHPSTETTPLPAPVAASLAISAPANAPNTNQNGLYQIETSSTPEGYEIIYYPPGQIPDATLRYPGAPAPSETKPTFPFPTPTGTPTINVPKSKACLAQTLYEFYTAQELPLPHHTTLGVLYEQAGLGTIDTYTGTAEQNTKLLQYLQAKLGCFVSAPPVENKPTAIPIPTTAQLAARLNPNPVQIHLANAPGLLKSSSGSVDYVYRSTDTAGHLVAYDISSLQPEKGGNDFPGRIRGLKAQFGIDWDTLPSFNLSDYVSQFHAYPPNVDLSELKNYTQLATLGTQTING